MLYIKSLQYIFHINASSFIHIFPIKSHTHSISCQYAVRYCIAISEYPHILLRHSQCGSWIPAPLGSAMWGASVRAAVKALCWIWKRRRRSIVRLWRLTAGLEVTMTQECTFREAPGEIRDKILQYATAGEPPVPALIRAPKGSRSNEDLYYNSLFW